MMDPNQPDPYVDPIEYNPGDTVLPSEPESWEPDGTEETVEQTPPEDRSDG